MLHQALSMVHERLFARPATRHLPMDGCCGDLRVILLEQGAPVSLAGSAKARAGIEPWMYCHFSYRTNKSATRWVYPATSWSRGTSAHRSDLKRWLFL